MSKKEKKEKVSKGTLIVATEFVARAQVVGRKGLVQKTNLFEKLTSYIENYDEKATIDLTKDEVSFIMNCMEVVPVAVGKEYEVLASIQELEKV